MAPSDFLQLFQPHSQDLERFLLRKIGCAATAADVFQETWLRIVKLDPKRTVENPRALLFRIAANLVTDHYRRSSKEAAHLVENGLTIDIPDDAPSAETEIFSRQQYEALLAAVADLPPKRRAVFIMNKFEHKTYSEIAVELGVSESTVMKQMIKAIAFCKDRVDKAGGDI
ncbi:DNA-directed RNA polymerase sigma-70 factor [Nitrospira sp. KM1]|uniref:RNA polymerase sigma factor n=1 Tax=Nitrospira sp. KM1 TaxID=1936990 RepID=UPI0013A70D5E|nr:RNA polymerase sigma factor [Nitrospira sp. KM1]BCA54548.1 DNA-directed RNA polymerase sigma-70 factor [Nitrospira sp. KM1]